MSIHVGDGLPELPDRPTEDDVGAVLAAIPGLRWPPEAWADFLRCPADVQLRNLRVLAASTVNPGPDWAERFLDVGKVLLIVAGAVTGVAGAVAGVQAIKW